MVPSVMAAELLLFRTALQVLLSARWQALFNRRLCWQAYRRLEHVVESIFGGAAGASLVPGSGGPLGTEADVADLHDRICFGMGWFCLELIVRHDVVLRLSFCRAVFCIVFSCSVLGGPTMCRGSAPI